MEKEEQLKEQEQRKDHEHMEGQEQSSVSLAKESIEEFEKEAKITKEEDGKEEQEPKIAPCKCKGNMAQKE